LLWIACALISLYGGTYAALYHRGVKEAEPYGSFYFYVPFNEVMTSPDVPRRHFVLMAIYSPINQLHREYFGGRSPCVCMLRGLSQPSEEVVEQKDEGPE
jgi:hypothetical protein